MKKLNNGLALALVVTIGVVALPVRSALAQSIGEQLEPAAKIVADQPVAALLVRGLVVIPYRTENLRIVAVFGPSAREVTPRVGHLHLTLDGAPWHWVDTSGEPVVLTGLSPGPHRVTLKLANANHEPLDEAQINFTVPPAQGHAH